MYHRTAASISKTRRPSFVGGVDSSADLVKEDILSVPALGREVFEIAVLVDAVLLTQLLPELTSHFTHAIVSN